MASKRVCVMALVFACMAQWLSVFTAHRVPLFSKESDTAITFDVPRVSLRDLQDETSFRAFDTAQQFKNALTTRGIVAVSDIPRFAELRRKVLIGMHGHGDLADIDIGVAKNSGVCGEKLFEDATAFRDIVSDAAKAFTKRVDDVFRDQYPEDEPLMWNLERTRSYESLSEIISDDSSEHLEHFHSYHKPVDANESSSDDAAVAIDMHADQGLFIAFTPGILVRELENGQVEATANSAGKFYVALEDDIPAVARFGDRGDVIVFMLGDGVNQVINPKLSGPPYLHATSHAMAMPTHSNDECRVWYGRMFLPPANGVSEKHGVSFGDLRARMLRGVQEGDGVGTGVGCSRAMRETDEACGENQIYCWMRCMDYTEEANPETCGALNLELQCASQFDQIYRKGIDSHGDYNPTCTNSTEFISPTPSIADSRWAQSDPYRESCSDADWKTFLSKSDYANSLRLKDSSEDGDGELYLMWTVSGERFLGKMAYKGTAGYLAMGIENPGGGHNGMNGASIVMGIYDPDPSIDDLVFEPVYVGTRVDEYIIHDSLSAFRHWKTPITPGVVDDGEMFAGGCFTGMTFTANGGIATQSLNMTGLNSMIWAIHTDSFYKGYHGWANRGHLCIDLTVDVGHQEHASSYFLQRCADIDEDQDYATETHSPTSAEEIDEQSACDQTECSAAKSWERVSAIWASMIVIIFIL
eukprot:gene690-1146_t